MFRLEYKYCNYWTFTLTAATAKNQQYAFFQIKNIIAVNAVQLELNLYHQQPIFTCSLLQKLYLLWFYHHFNTCLMFFLTCSVNAPKIFWVYHKKVFGQKNLWMKVCHSHRVHKFDYLVINYNLKAIFLESLNSKPDNHHARKSPSTHHHPSKLRLHPQGPPSNFFSSSDNHIIISQRKS